MLLNTTTNPHYRSCVFMTDIYLTIRPVCCQFMLARVLSYQIREWWERECFLPGYENRNFRRNNSSVETKRQFIHLVRSTMHNYWRVLWNELGVWEHVYIECVSGMCSTYVFRRRLRGLVVGMLASGARVQTRPKSDALKNPPHAFLRTGRERICPMSQLCGM
jgi:hypothetical protein